MFARPFLNSVALFWLLINLSLSASGQNPKDFAMANQLMQYGNYKDAAIILQRLYKENPRNYPVFNRLVRCLTELKDYKQAIKITKEQLGGKLTDTPLAVSLGDLYYLSGDSVQALATWKGALESNRNTPQTWRDVAEALANRKFYKESEKVYLEARAFFKTPSMFLNELTNIYVTWGKYDKAAKEWVSLVAQDPSKSALLQRRMFRFEDEDYLDAFIVELEDASRQFQAGTPQFFAFKDLLIWLYTEKRMYRKALAVAKQLETMDPSGQTPVLTLGSRLVAAKEFVLAEEAFSYYEKAGQPHIIKLSIEERARLFRAWGDEIRRSETGTIAEAFDKYRKSLEFLDRWKNQYGEDTLPADLAILFVQLTLDQFKDTERTLELIAQLRKRPDMQQREGELLFLEGRIWQMKGESMRARLAFNRALKSAPISELAEKSRYHLGLTDFYAGDFEFALIQLRALERQSASFYANDALRIRALIQEKNPTDTLRTDLKKLAVAMQLFDAGKYAQALDSVRKLLRVEAGKPIAGFALEFAADALSLIDIHLTASLLQENNTWISSVPNAERLMWMRARYNDLLFQQKKPDIASDSTMSSDNKNIFGIPVSNPAQAFSLLKLQPTEMPTKREIVQQYELLLSRFPVGFFAQQVRERLQQLEKEAS